MPRRNIVVVGGSAGGIDALRVLVAHLPAGLRASVFAAVHLRDGLHSTLPGLLDAAGPLTCLPAFDGPYLESFVYVARPGLHLSLVDGEMRVDAGPRENGFRPAIDRLFRSAARAHGPRVIGVVLSGMRDDGTQGLAAIQRCGGLTLVQDPKEAPFPSMPRSALEFVKGAEVHSAVGLAERIVAATGESVMQALDDENEDDLASDGDRDEDEQERIVSCPDCGGVLREVTGGGFVQYRCRVGHRFGPESLLDAQSEHVEAALWAAVNALVERRDFTRRLARRARSQGLKALAERSESIAGEAEGHAKSIGDLLMGMERAEAAAARGGEDPSDPPQGNDPTQ